MPPILRGLLLVILLLSGVSVRAGEQQELIIPLNEKLLARFEAVTAHLAIELRADKALKADYNSLGHEKQVPDKVTPTIEGINAIMAPQHPRLAAALATDGWTTGEFFGVMGTLIGAYVGTAEYDLKRKPADGFEKNVAFVATHKARVEAALGHLPKK